MRKHRSRIAVIHDILSSVYDGPKRASHIAREANLPMDRLKPILGRLLEEGYLERVGPNYEITEKGTILLSEVKKIKRILEGLGLA